MSYQEATADRSRFHVVESADSTVALCGAENVRPFLNVTSPKRFYLTTFNGTTKRYDHYCARCVRLFEKAISARVPDDGMTAMQQLEGTHGDVAETYVPARNVRSKPLGLKLRDQ